MTIATNPYTVKYLMHYWYYWWVFIERLYYHRQSFLFVDIILYRGLCQCTFAGFIAFYVNNLKPLFLQWVNETRAPDGHLTVNTHELRASNSGSCLSGGHCGGHCSACRLHIDVNENAGTHARTHMHWCIPEPISFAPVS